MISDALGTLTPSIPQGQVFSSSGPVSVDLGKLPVPFGHKLYYKADDTRVVSLTPSGMEWHDAVGLIRWPEYQEIRSI